MANLNGLNLDGNNSVGGYMNKFLDFATNVWQQQQRSASTYQQCLEDSNQYALEQLDVKSAEIASTFDQNASLKIESVRMREESTRLSQENKEFRKRLREQENTERRLKEELQDVKRRLVEQKAISIKLRSLKDSLLKNTDNQNSGRKSPMKRSRLNDNVSVNSIWMPQPISTQPTTSSPKFLISTTPAQLMTTAPQFVKSSSAAPQSTTANPKVVRSSTASKDATTATLLPSSSYDNLFEIFSNTAATPNVVRSSMISKASTATATPLPSTSYDENFSDVSDCEITEVEVPWEDGTGC